MTCVKTETLSFSKWEAVLYCSGSDEHVCVSNQVLKRLKWGVAVFNLQECHTGAQKTWWGGRLEGLHHLALRLDSVKREIYRAREEDIVRTRISSSMRPPLHYLTQAIDPLHTHTRSHSSVCLPLLWIISSLFLLILSSSHLTVGECSKHLFEIIIPRTKCHNYPIGLCLIG